MKNIKQFLHQPTLQGLIIGLAALALASFPVKATPYASGCVNSTGDQNGDIGFFLNEGGATVTVIYDDGSTNANFDGITTGLNVPRGSNYFNLQGHNGYQIRVFKIGSGSPSKISVDTDSNSIWANPGGLAINQNPKIGPEFGRIYVGSRGTGGYGFGTPGFKNYGIYALNADFTTALGQGTNSYGYSFYVNSGGSGPWRMRVAPGGSGIDNKLIVTDFSGGNSSVLLWNSDLSGYQPLLKGIGGANRLAAQTGNDSTWEVAVHGSLNTGDLQVWISEADWAIPANFANYGPNTGSGMYNDLLRFDIGAGPIPSDGWPGPPQYAYTVGLEGIANLRPFVDIDPKSGNIIAAIGRANGSNPNIQVLDPTGQTFLYLSGLGQPYFSQDVSQLAANDPWNGNLAGGTVGTYGGARVSPDGKYLASVDANSGITVANMLNGIPDDSTVFIVPNTPYTANSRGMDWDAADNVYICSSGQLLTRAYSLGATATCITSNDWTGTNGTFVAAAPPVIAKLTVTQPFASQNYGTPIPGVARISINTNFLSSPLAVSFSRSGALYANPSQAMYAINTNSSPYGPYGVQILTNSVIFPAGNFLGGGNFYVDVLITPTAFPVSTNSQSVVLGLSNPSAYQFGTPSKGTIFIQNTGPQLLVLTAASAGTSMYRGVTNDYAKFVITRNGDTNGPGNSAGSVSPNAFTITNLSFFGTAKYPLDYTARPQRADPADDNKIETPVDGPTAIVIYPGDTQVTCILGNPVLHTNFNYTPTNLTIVINLTNAISGTGSTNNIPTPEGYTYNVLPATVTLTELDNAVGPEVIVWSDPLTNAADSVNYTLTFAGTNFGPGGMPVVLPNYVNYQTSYLSGGSNDFEVLFGSDISTNVVSVPPSPVMLVSNWPLKALKMTVNKSQSTICGVNVFPHQQFGGNYALRFSMFLSLWSQYINDPFITQNFREYALFGVNHIGTNCMFRPSTTMIDGTGMFPTNSDGAWFAVDSGSQGITPADFELYLPGPVPNNGNPYGAGGGLRGWSSYSATALLPQGVFKHPPFDCMNTTEATRTVAKPGGGEPVNKWVDVSVEITSQTNLALYLNRSTWLGVNTAGLNPITNGLGFGYSYTNGTIMLGYDDPDRTISDASAFVYFSNVRVVELSPYISLMPGLLTNNIANSLIVTQGSSLVLTAAVNYATAPITSIWFKASSAVRGINNGTLSNPNVQSNWFNAAFANDSLALNNVGAAQGTNYVLVVRDPAGSVTSAPVSLDVFLTPANQIVTEGATALLSMRIAGPTNTMTYQWMTNNVNLVTSAHYPAASNLGTNVTATNLNIVNAQAADALTYAMMVVHTNATLTQYVTLTTVAAAPPASRTNLVGTSGVVFTAPAVTGGPLPTYQWRKGTANVAGATGTSLTLANLTTNDAGTYYVRMTRGGFLDTSTNVLYVIQPKFSNEQVAGANVVLSYFSPNTLEETTNSFRLQSSPVVTGPYVDTDGNYTISADGTVQITVPTSGGSMFYRLIH